MHTESLNGTWDFFPEYDRPSENPPEEYHEEIVVPSVWNRSAAGVRRPGEPHVHDYKPERGAGRCAAIAALGEETEFLFDNFEYPLAWTATRNAWLGRCFDWTPGDGEEAVLLELDAVSPRCSVFLNRKYLGSNDDPCLPVEFDITAKLEEGPNRLDVHVMDHEYDDAGRTLSPSGNAFVNESSGIWQDVRLARRGKTRCESLAVNTSTRRDTFEVELEIVNAGDHRCTAVVTATIEGVGEPPSLEPVELDLAAGERAVRRVSARWPEPRLWEPGDPYLYSLHTEIGVAGRIIDRRSDRFGFREVWIEGRDIMLNGAPIRLFSDWGHKASVCHLTEGWIRSWYAMIRDGNMNHSRLHSHPHPSRFLDIADETGILITDETALFGAGGAQAADSEEYWIRAADHIRRFVRRDRNHPSVILWSVENEMRWNRDRTGKTVEKLPEMRALFNRLDPTRPAYHDGDSSLWNERRQPMVSRHYGKECTGLGWWDGARPLHSGELSLYHYAGPNNTVQRGDDEVWADYDAIDRAAAVDTAYIVEDGRSNGVCCFGPWNISCHQNLRLHDTVRPDYTDQTAPGIKPKVIKARTSEFEYWRYEEEPRAGDANAGGPGAVDPTAAGTGLGAQAAGASGAGTTYHPKESFEVQKHGFRPVACIDRSRRTGYFGGARFERTLHVVNDTRQPIAGVAWVRLEVPEETPLERRWAYALGPGEIRSMPFGFALPQVADIAEARYSAGFDGGKETLDSWTRTIKLSPGRRAEAVESIAVYGGCPAVERLEKEGARRIASLGEADPEAFGVLVIGAHALEGTVAEKRTVRSYCTAGGRVVLLEQGSSVLTGMPCDRKVVQSAFPRSPHHPILEGIAREDLEFWGDGAYGDPSGDSHVARTLYRKGDLEAARCIVDAGEGNFGDGDLDSTALFEAPVGAGLLIACQLRLQDVLETIPTAAGLLAAMLDRARTYDPATPSRKPAIVRTNGSSREAFEEGLEAAKAGGMLLVRRPTEDQLRSIAETTGVSVTVSEVEEIYQAVRAERMPLLDGVSNWDTCGIESYCYTPEDRAADVVVARKVINDGEGIQPLLVTTAASCCRELFVYGGRTELLRSYTVSTCLASPEPIRIVACRIACGSGSIVISCFAPEGEPGERFERFEHQLLLNSGVIPETTVLDGDEVEPALFAGDGYPESVYRYTGRLSNRVIEDMRERTIQGYERMASTAMLAMPDWERAPAPKGTLGASTDPEAIYYTVHTAVPRTNVETNLDIPNPEALTNLELSGDGTVEVTVNGITRGPVTVEPAGTTIADIPLERGYNYILIIRYGGTVPLSQIWRTTMRAPETSFRFG